MRVFLLDPVQDFLFNQEPPPHEEVIAQDLELKTLWGAMAAGDAFLFEVARSVMLASVSAPDAISHRQAALRDSLENRDVVRRLYELAGQAIEAQRKVWRGLERDSPSRILSTSVAKLDLLVEFLRGLRELADAHAPAFRSGAFTRLLATLREELDEDYLQKVEAHLRELRFPHGTLISAEVGPGNTIAGHVLRVPRERRLLERLGLSGRSSYSFTIPNRDENGFRALTELQNKGLGRVAAALAHATDHVVGFFARLRSEVGFYVACLNLHERLIEKGEPTCFPSAPGEPNLVARGLYDPCLTLHLRERAVGNDLDAAGKSLVMITGANHGGKSTLLRSVGLAQLMMQSGMFVCADAFAAETVTGLFTHFKREEDPTMTSGKLDEELARMSAIADAIRPGGMLLCNESFASTNEREGSELARQVIAAMLESGVKVLFVTHLFDLAHGFFERRRPDALFLRAERRPDGGRTFRIFEGAPLPTSFGLDSYRRIFGADTDTMPALAEETA
jgi:DNA mismatch repair ATPase MutS